MKKRIVGILKWIACVGTIIIFSYPISKDIIFNGVSMITGAIVGFIFFYKLEQWESRL